jgi:hypothetical protein
VPSSYGAVVLADEMSAALDLAGTRLQNAASQLAASPALHERPEVARAAARAIARSDVPLALAAGQKLGLSIGDLASIGVRRQAQATGAQGVSPVQAALQIAGSAGADAFPVEHRAAACLYEGFGSLGTDTLRAARAFDRAVGLGADLLEVLRGKLLLTLSDPTETCPDCGRSHGPSDHDHPSLTDGASAADRFARAARHVPGAEPFAAAASILAAEAWNAEDETKNAVASIEAGRAAAKGSAAMRAELDLLEANAIRNDRPERTIELLDGLLKDDPTHLRAWRAKVELAMDRDDEKGADDLLIQAAAATGDRELGAMARTLRIRRGEIAPFAAFTPGAVTAGALAAEALTLFSARKAIAPLPPIAEACRAALAPPAQLAFDAALLAFAADADDKQALKLCLARIFGAWWGAPPMLAKLAAITWILGLQGELVPTVRPLAGGKDAGPALGALFDAAVAAEDTQVANEVLRLGAAHWKRTEVQDRRRALDRLSTRPRHLGDLDAAAQRRRSAAKASGVLDPEEARIEFDKALAPEIRPGMIWQQDADDLDDDGDLDDLDDGDIDPWDEAALPGAERGGDAVFPKALWGFLGALGLSPAMLKRLSAPQLQAIQSLIADMASRPFTPARLEQVQREVEKVLKRR